MPPDAPTGECPLHAVEQVRAPGRGAWVQVTRGEVRLSDLLLRERDGDAVEGEKALRFRARRPARVLAFDLG